MLEAHLSLTDNIRRGNTDITKFDGVHETRYLKIVERYKTSDKMPNRPIDHFSDAFGALCEKINETGTDCLGEIFEKEITYGEHGQFFTPEPVADIVAQIIDAPSHNEEGRKVTCDPCCGSGRMLLAAHKANPAVFLVGVDLDPRCAKMCALNLLFRGLDGDVYHGDSLAAKMTTVWTVKAGGFVIEYDLPETPQSIKNYAEEKMEQMKLL
jgi:type I restriction-modification system DNA methylase subunit